MAVLWNNLTSAQQQTAILAARAIKTSLANKPRATQKIMLAIAGAESSYNARRYGDPLANQSGSNKTACQSINCSNYCSFGLWQIFLAWHWDKIVASGGPDARYYPCEAVEWLYDVYNSTIIAGKILDSSGLTAWTVYRNASTGTTPNYLEWMDAAEVAMQIVEAENPDPDPDPDPNPEPTFPAGIALIGSGLMFLLMYLFTIK